MLLREMELQGFTERLAAKDAVPGGGGASALAASLGAALAAMVGNLTVGKPKYAAHEEDVKNIIERAQRLREKLNGLIDGDAEAFAPLAEVYAMPKDAPEREEKMERALSEAASVPLEILRCACEGIDLHAELKDKCSVLAISDVATGVVLCWAALYGAAVNVRVNTRLMKDRERAKALDNETEMLMKKYWKIADEVYERVWEKLS